MCASEGQRQKLSRAAQSVNRECGTETSIGGGSGELLGGTLSISFNLQEYLLNKLPLRIGVSVPVGFETFDKFVFDLRIPGGISWMPAKPITEDQFRRVRWCANVDVMRTTATKRRHTLDEEHSVCTRILGPVDVTKTRKGSDQLGPNRDIAKNDEDINNRFRGEIGNGRASEMLNA